MEEKNHIKQSHEHEQTEEGKPDKNFEADQAEKLIPMLGENQLPKDTEKERQENKGEISVGLQTDSPKKSKEGLKQNAKEKHTIPQPFSLATEKRTSKERRGSMDFSAANDPERRSKEKLGSFDFKDPQPKLSKSVSLKHKVQSSASTAGETSKLRRANSTTANITSAKPKATSTNRADKRAGKKQGDQALETCKLRKPSTFRTPSLPEYPPPSKPAKKKVPDVTRLKAPVVGQRSKSVSNAQSSKMEDKGKWLQRR